MVQKRGRDILSSESRDVCMRKENAGVDMEN